MHILVVSHNPLKLLVKDFEINVSESTARNEHFRLEDFASYASFVEADEWVIEIII